MTLPALLLGTCFGLTAQAALFSGLGGQVVYDDDRNITWLANANLAATEDFGVFGIVNGASNQTRAVEWIDAMNASDGGNGYLGFNQWRLPTATIPDPTCTSDATGMFPSGNSNGFNCTGGEFGHLFYVELGGTAGVSILDSGDPDVALFSDIRNSWYWTGTENPDNLGNIYVMAFDAATNSGLQANFVGAGSFGGFAWPVADGNPFNVVVPIPAAAWLFGSALGLLAWVRRRAA